MFLRIEQDHNWHHISAVFDVTLMSAAIQRSVNLRISDRVCQLKELRV